MSCISTHTTNKCIQFYGNDDNTAENNVESGGYGHYGRGVYVFVVDMGAVVEVEDPLAAVVETDGAGSPAIIEVKLATSLVTSRSPMVENTGMGLTQQRTSQGWMNKL